MEISSIAQMPTVDDYRSYQREWLEISKPLMRHLGELMSLGMPRVLQSGDGSIELMEPAYPEGVEELIASAQRMVADQRAHLAESFGIKLESA